MGVFVTGRAGNMAGNVTVIELFFARFATLVLGYNIFRCSTKYYKYPKITKPRYDMDLKTIQLNN